MKRTLYFVMALALVLGFTQCKKEQVNTPGNETKTVNITLKVGGNGGGSRHDINTTSGAVAFEDGDVIYVGNGSTYIGTLIREGGLFSGSINEPADGTEIHFYFVGGLTPSDTPEAGTTSSFTVDISNQRTKMPVLSCNHVTYSSGTKSYSCVLQNQCALVKFTTASGTDDPVHVGGLYTKAQIDFAAPSITHTATTGFVKLYPDADDNTAKWAVLLPQDDFSNIEGVMADKGYTISMQPETTISADGFITGEQAIGITSTPSHNRYLQWAVRDLTLEGGDHVYGTLSGDYKITVAAGATITLRNATINRPNNQAHTWAGLNCLGDANIILQGTNNIKGFYEDYPGIHIAEGYTLTIGGDGSLTASSNDWGAGIGGGVNLSCGNIVINSGTINATGGTMSSGIGAGCGNRQSIYCGDITINGGTVTAQGGRWAAGIGSGAGFGGEISISTCGTIRINGGTVIATGGDGGNAQDFFPDFNFVFNGGAGIGTGSAFGPDFQYLNTGTSNCGDIIIESGVTSVTATKGSGAINSIGKNDNLNPGTCGTINIGGTVYWDGSAYQNGGGTYLPTSPLVYPAPTPAEATVTWINSQIQTIILGNGEGEIYQGIGVQLDESSWYGTDVYLSEGGMITFQIDSDGAYAEYDIKKIEIYYSSFSGNLPEGGGWSNDGSKLTWDDGLNWSVILQHEGPDPDHMSIAVTQVVFTLQKSTK